MDWVLLNEMTEYRLILLGHFYFSTSGSLLFNDLDWILVVYLFLFLESN